MLPPLIQVLDKHDAPLDLRRSLEYATCAYSTAGVLDSEETIGFNVRPSALLPEGARIRTRSLLE
jgi:hypothetical protein